jgi:hypothetical protein
VRPGLIIIDTLARCSVGADENSAQAMGEIVHALDSLRTATGAAVLLVHHSRKDGQTERGSVALRCAADVMMHLARKRNGDRLVLTCDKMKDAPEFSSMGFRLEQVGQSCVLEPTELEGSAAKQGQSDTLVLSLLPVGSSVRYGEWRSRAEIAGVKKGAFDKARARLGAAGLVMQTADGYSRRA